ncbi:MAG: glycosyltransferase family 2 protein [Parcubacteria group bacterium]|jgi:hypothetical protein
MQNSKTACLPAGRELSVIIVNYRSEQYLKNCVASLFKYLHNITFEIIVVNNDNNILEVEAHCNASLRADVNIQIINHHKNIGFGAACNLGAELVRGEILWFLNPDTEILSASLEKIVDKLKNSDKVAVIGPRLITAANKTQQWCAGKESSLWRNIKNNFGIVESKKVWESEFSVLADWVSGAALFVKKEVFERVGGFDENFFMYFEDEDLCRRIRLAGYDVLYYPAVSIRHLVGQSREGLLKQKMQFYRSLVYFFKKAKKNG